MSASFLSEIHQSLVKSSYGSWGTACASLRALRGLCHLSIVAMCKRVCVCVSFLVDILVDGYMLLYNWRQACSVLFSAEIFRGLRHISFYLLYSCLLFICYHKYKITKTNMMISAACGQRSSRKAVARLLFCVGWIVTLATLDVCLALLEPHMAGPNDGSSYGD